MKNNLFVTGLASTVLLLALCGQAAAQYDESSINVPPSGEVNLKAIPRMGEEVLGGLLTSRIEQNPLQEYFGNTRVCLVPGLWECHAWFNPDGTGVEFYARKKPDGSVELASDEFWYRMAGTPGDYHLCRKPSVNGKEVCEKYRWEEGHYLYDEWFNNYDRPAESGFPAYRNVHEHNMIIPGHR